MTEARFEQMKSKRSNPGLLALALLAGLLLTVNAAAARAAETPLPVPALSSANAAGYELTPAQKLRAAYWRGQTCSTALCKSPRPGGITEVASFGLAAFGGAWISRRRSS